MQSHHPLVNHILELPHAAMVLQDAIAALEEERKKRQDFYDMDITETRKVEFINGELIVRSPVKKQHNDASGALFQLINPYVKKHKLGYVGYEKIMISLTRNDYEPDVCFFDIEKSKHFEDEQSLFPAPDLIIEVLSPKTASHDRGIKYDDYQAHAVTEYWIVDPHKETVEQYCLGEDGIYELILKSGEGRIHSKAIKGLEIAIEAIFDEHKNLIELKRLMGG